MMKKMKCISVGECRTPLRIKAMALFSFLATAAVAQNTLPSVDLFEGASFRNNTLSHTRSKDEVGFREFDETTRYIANDDGTLDCTPVIEVSTNTPVYYTVLNRSYDSDCYAYIEGTEHRKVSVEAVFEYDPVTKEIGVVHNTNDPVGVSGNIGAVGGDYPTYGEQAKPYGGIYFGNDMEWELHAVFGGPDCASISGLDEVKDGIFPDPFEGFVLDSNGSDRLVTVAVEYLYDLHGPTGPAFDLTRQYGHVFDLNDPLNHYSTFSYYFSKLHLLDGQEPSTTALEISPQSFRRVRQGTMGGDGSYFQEVVDTLSGEMTTEMLKELAMEGFLKLSYDENQWMVGTGVARNELSQDESACTYAKTKYRVRVDSSQLNAGQNYVFHWVERFIASDGAVTNDVPMELPFRASGGVVESRVYELDVPSEEGVVFPALVTPDFTIDSIEFGEPYLPPGGGGSVSEMWAKAAISNLKDPAKQNEYLSRIRWKVQPYKDGKLLGAAAASQGLAVDGERAQGSVVAGEEVGKVYVVAYDAWMEGIYHAEVLEISCSICGDGGDCGIGSGSVQNECVELTVNMGRNTDGTSLGNIVLMEEEPSAYTYTPFALSFSAPPEYVSGVYNEHGCFRQVKTAEALLDITVPGELEVAVTNIYFTTNGTAVATNTVVSESMAGFEMSFYQLGDVTASNGAFIVDGGAVPFKVWRVEDPDLLQNNFERVRISEIMNGETSSKTNVNLFTWEPDKEGWELAKGGGAQVVKRGSVVDGDMRVETRLVTDADGNDASKVFSYYRTYFWGEALVKEVQDPDGAALITDYTYYAAENDPARMGKLESIKYPDGSWVKYFYDDAGRRESVWSPWLDVTLEQATESNCRRKDTSYEPVDSSDIAQTNGYVLLRPRLVTSTIDGTAVGKTAFAYYTNGTERIEKVVEYDDPVSGGYGDSANRVSTSMYHLETHADPDLADNLKRAESPDGLVATYGYVRGGFTWTSIADGTFTFTADTNGAWLCETVTNGIASSPAGVANKTTMSVSYRNSRGGVALSETHVYTGSGYERIGWSANEFDYDLPQYQAEAVGHVVNRYFADGTVEENQWSSCCGLESVVDRQGMTEFYEYDDLDRRYHVNNDDLDIDVHYTFDAAGRQVAMTESGSNGLSRTTGSSYDLAGQLTTSTNEAQLVTHYNYQDGGRITTVTMPGGATQVTETYIDGRTKRVYGTGTVEQTYEYGFDSATGEQSTTVYTGPQGTSSPRWERTVSDADGKTVRVERPGYGGTLLSSVYYYDATNRLWKTEQYEGTTLKTSNINEYDSLGSVKRSGLDVGKDGLLEVASMDRITDSDSSYWNDGTDWWRKSTSTTYPKDNDGTALTNSVSLSRLTGLGVQSAFGNLQSEIISTDVFGNETVSQSWLDCASRTVVQVVDVPTSNQDQTSTTVNGLLQSVQSASSAGTTQYGYDDLGRQNSVVDPRIGTATTHYNSFGQVEYTVDTHGVITSNVFDSASGLLTQRHVVPPSGGPVATYFDYDNLGNLTRQWGSATYPVAYDYDDYGQKTHMHTYRGGKDWDGATWPGGNALADTTEWVYDEATGLLTDKLYADGKGTSYSYWPGGQLRARSWERGVDTDYYYDDLGQLTSVDYSDSTPDISYTYDRMGRQATVTDVQGVHSFEYTDEGLLDVEKLDGVETIDRAYDSHGRSSGYSVDDASSFVSYGYDAYGRFSAITSIVDSVTSVVDYTYVPSSTLLSGHTASTAGGSPALTVTKGYESDRNLIVGVTNTAVSGIVSSFTYTNDGLGRRTRRDDQRSMGVSPVSSYWDFGYNSRSELTNAVRHLPDATPVAGQSKSYLYDNIGNRRIVGRDGLSEPSASEIYTANELNQYVARTVSSFVNVMGTATNTATVTVRDVLHNDLPVPVIRQDDYFYKAYPVDNLTQAFNGSLEINAVINPAGTNDPDIVKTEVRSAFVPQTPEALVYDGDGNMTSDGRFTYIYNGENRLVVVSNASTLVEYAYDYQGRMFERTVNGVQHDYLWDGWNIIGETSSNGTNVFTWGLDLSGSMQGAGGVGGLVSASLSGTNVFYCYDANGNVNDLMDLDGSVVAQYDYDSFGNLLIDEETIPGNPFKFSAKFWELETDLLHYQLRPNKPGIGRWIQRDPIEERGGINLYCLVENNPVDRFDILGLVPNPLLDPHSVGLDEQQNPQSDAEKRQAERLKQLKLWSKCVYLKFRYFDGYRVKFKDSWSPLDPLSIFTSEAKFVDINPQSDKVPKCKTVQALLSCKEGQECKGVHDAIFSDRQKPLPFDFYIKYSFYGTKRYSLAQEWPVEENWNTFWHSHGVRNDRLVVLNILNERDKVKRGTLDVSLRLPTIGRFDFNSIQVEHQK